MIRQKEECSGNAYKNIPQKCIRIIRNTRQKTYGKVQLTGQHKIYFKWENVLNIELMLIVVMDLLLKNENKRERAHYKH